MNYIFNPTRIFGSNRMQILKGVFMFKVLLASCLLFVLTVSCTKKEAAVEQTTTEAAATTATEAAPAEATEAAPAEATEAAPATTTTEAAQ